MPAPPETPVPVRVDQLVERNPFEGLLDYKRRCWEAEFDAAIKKIEDTPTRNALFSLKNLLRL